MRAETRLRRMLVTVQFAIALMLLVGAGLLLQSFRRAATVDIGFDPHDLVMLRIAPATGAYPEPQAAAALYARLIDAARAVPGVIDAAFINHAPFGSASITTSLSIEGRPALDSSTQVFYRTVSASYLPTMRMTVSAGRWFEDADIRSPGGSFVINETLARQHWQGANAIGQRITVARASQARADFGKPLTGTIVGVVGDVRQWGRDVAPVAEVYVPYTLETWPWGMLMVRARDGAQSIPALNRAVRSVDPRLLAEGPAGDADFGVMADNVAGSLEPRKFSMSLITVFAMCALMLAAMGMYGVVAHGIAQRTREIGVRKALGATDTAIGSLVLRESLVMIGAGVAIGCAAAWAGARLIRALLFDTGIVDPVAYLGTIALLVGVALLATYLPARHAMRLSPSVAMRTE
jgi:predicted permease